MRLSERDEQGKLIEKGPREPESVVGLGKGRGAYLMSLQDRQVSEEGPRDEDVIEEEVREDKVSEEGDSDGDMDSVEEVDEEGIGAELALCVREGLAAKANRSSSANTLPKRPSRDEQVWFARYSSTMEQTVSSGEGDMERKANSQSSVQTQERREKKRRLRRAVGAMLGSCFGESGVSRGWKWVG
jgi:hypothetical protein